MAAFGRRQFTHSKVMAWVAFDRAICSVEEFGLDGPVERWRGTASGCMSRCAVNASPHS
jgi:GH15 family glucan-1,4-alpha-glucosidase